MYYSFKEYIENETQEQRQSHIDLTIEHNFKCRKEGRDYKSKRHSQHYARERIVNYLIEIGILHSSLKGQKFGKSGEVVCCHKCDCGAGLSNNPNAVCHEPKHLYLGNAKENYYDINPITGKAPINAMNFDNKGRKWIHNENERKFVKLNELDEYLSKGYKLGNGLKNNQFKK